MCFRHNNVCTPEQFKDKFKENYENNNVKVQMINTFEENLKFVSNVKKIKLKRQERSRQALGNPTATDLKAMIRMNLIKHKEVTTEDATLAEKVRRPDISGIKGKTTRVKLSPMKSQIIDTPKELIHLNQDATIIIDGFKNKWSLIFNGNNT